MKKKKTQIKNIKNETQERILRTLSKMEEELMEATLTSSQDQSGITTKL